MNDDARDFFFRARSIASSIGKIGNIVAVLALRSPRKPLDRQMLSTPAQHTSGEFCDSLKSCFSEDRCCLGGSTARTAHRNCGPVLHDFRNSRCKLPQRNGNRARDSTERPVVFSGFRTSIT
jgi:hypothetical protein